MRAFFSLVLTLLFLSSTLVLLKMSQSASNALRAAQTHLLQLETFYAHEIEVRRAILNTIGITNAYSETLLLAAGKPIALDEKILLIGTKLTALEPAIEHAFAETHNITVDLWCGAITSTERRGLAERMLAQHTALKCTGCEDWKEQSFYRSIPTSICASAIIVDLVTRDVRIAEDPNPFFTPTLQGRDLAFGASIFDSRRNISSVVVIPARTTIRFVGDQ